MTHIVLLSSHKVTWLITVKKSHSNYVYGKWTGDSAEIKLNDVLIIEQGEPSFGFRVYKIDHIHWNYGRKECTINVSESKES